MKGAAKALVEKVTGRDIKRITRGSVALIRKRERDQAWFCYDVFLQWLLNANVVDLVVDVGANEGQFARRMRRIYSGEMVSFEPVSEPFARLAEAAGTDPHWTAHRYALGSANTTSTINVAPNTKFSSVLGTSEYSKERFRRSAPHREELVPMKRLDEVLPPALAGSTRRRIFLKLDTQGYDLEVFKGVGTYLDQIAILQSEVSLIPLYDGMPHWTDSIAAYEQAGFHVAGMFPVVRDAAGRIIEYDCLLVRRAED